MEIAKLEQAVAEQRKPEYETPQVKVLDEAEVLSAFQVTAANATVWWAC
jgi:hypothetical protein